MADSDKEGTESRPLDDDVWSAISAFQQILQAIPNDRASLETLAHAFGQIGDHTQAREYVLRLGKVLLEEKDAAAVAEFLPTLRSYAGDDTEATRLLADLEAMQQAGSGVAEGDKGGASETRSRQIRKSFNMAEELSCAWNLMQAGQLNEEEYSNVVQDLSDMSSQESSVTVSVLHVLEGRRYKGLERIVNAMARECSTPYVSLLSFDLQHDAISLLPLDYMVQRGVMVFDFVGKEGLAVVMNPYDKELRRDVEEQVGVNCHFFITLPSEFDMAVGKATEMLMAREEQESES